MYVEPLTTQPTPVSGKSRDGRDEKGGTANAYIAFAPVWGGGIFIF